MGDEHQDAAAAVCANCGWDAPATFCGNCGQATHLHHNLMGLVHDIGHGVFHFEGRIWHTLPLLALKPGELTRRYLAGERAKFVSPMALFLFSVFLMFAVVSNLSTHGGRAKVDAAPAKPEERNPALVLQAEQAKLAALRQQRAHIQDAAAAKVIDQKIADEQRDLKGLSVAAGAVTLLGGTRDGEDRPRAIHTNTGWRWLDSSIGHMSANPDLTLYKMKSYGYKYSWALIPISLPFIWLIFAFRRDVGFYDHAIFAIYSLSFMSLGVVVLFLLGRIGLPSAIITLAAILIPPLHMYRQLKGAYRLGRFGAIWRTCALLLITAITSLLFIAFLFWMGSE